MSSSTDENEKKFKLLLEKFKQVRQLSEKLCSPLEIDDYNMQAMIYGSPPKWNLGHCTWAFEAFVLNATISSYKIYNEKFAFLFNSYYETVGKRIRRDRRYLLSRPTVKELYLYRKYVDDAIEKFMTNDIASIPDRKDFLFRLELAINHEQQHQELLLTDLKHIFFESPLQPTYIENKDSLKHGISVAGAPGEPVFYNFSETLAEIGFYGSGFCYDNELGRHKVFLNPFSMMNRPVSCGEYREFVENGGYKQFQWWLSDGWSAVQNGKWEKPLYWEKSGQKWYEFSLYGMREIDENAPVCHISFFEADAFARFKGKRLPTEFEWEYVAANQLDEIQTGNFLDNRLHQPIPENSATGKCGNFFGNVWEWTQSAYLPYPHYKTPPGAIGEYNGKFMNDQRVLRGGSCATPRDHIRLSYRNFFEGFQRWQFAGFRLAGDI